MTRDEDQPEGRRRRKPHAPVSPRRAALVLIVWVLTLLAIATSIDHRGGWWGPTEREALLPLDQRSIRGEPWLLLRLADHEASASTLLEAGRRVEETLGEERVPFSPPRGELDAWLDSHALYLLPLDQHEALANRLSDENISAAVQSLHARLSSPLFGVSGEDARRDPLHFRGLVGHRSDPGAEPLPHGRAAVTAAGDVISADGTMLMIQLRSTRDLSTLRTEVREAMDTLPIEVDTLGPETRQEATTRESAPRAPKMVLALFAALAIALSASLRRARPTAAILLATVTPLAILGWILRGFDLWTLALGVLLTAFSCEAVLRLQPIARRAWVAPLVTASALLPLWLSPYPLWQRWAWIWALAHLGATGIVRLVMPALLKAFRGPSTWSRREFHLRPFPALSLIVCIAFGLGGVWAAHELGHRGIVATPFSSTKHEALEDLRRAHLYDSSFVVEVESEGNSAADALETAARQVAALESWRPSLATQIDSPGRFIIEHDVLARRRESLAQLGLRRRMQAVHDSLDAHGLRPNAFAEFLQGAASIDAMPGAQSALDSSLGPWISSRLRPPGALSSTWHIRTRVSLRAPVQDVALPALYFVDRDRSIGNSTASPEPKSLVERRIVPHGPTMAARENMQFFVPRLGLYIVSALWISAFLIWIGSGRLTTALASASAFVAATGGLLLVMLPLRIALGPHLLPGFLLVGVAATIAAGRSCRAVQLNTPVAASGILLAGLCQLCGGLALASSAETMWRELGLVVAIGTSFASGIGIFVSPGVDALLRSMWGPTDRKSP